MKKRAAVAIVLKVADIVSTIIGINRTGLDSEINPIARFIMGGLGLYGGCVLIFGIYCGLIWYAYKLDIRWALTAVIVLMSLVVANNIIQLMMMSKWL